MKKLWIAALTVTLVSSCASSNNDTSPESGELALPPEAASVPGEASGPVADDPFLNSSADPSALATAPAEAPSAPPATAPSVAEAPPVPVAPQDLPKPTTEGETSAAASAAAAPSTTAEAPKGPNADTPPPYTTSTTLDDTTQANNAEPSSAVPPPVVNSDRPSYRQQYKEYRNRVEANAAEADDRNERANFAHEGGAWQIGLEYDFTGVSAPASSTAGTVTDANTVGGALSWTYFPLRSIDTGRLGVGLRGGAYFSKYDTINGTTKNTNARKLSALTYGVRATYEFDYWIAQLFVPFAFVGYDQVSGKAFTDGVTNVTLPARKFGSVNYGAGLNFNLNRIEPSSASRSLVSTGIRKYYLSYTFQQRSGSELTGASHFLGLRFEY